MEIPMNRFIPSLVMLTLSAVSLTATARVTEADVLGSAAQPSVAERTVVIDNKTKAVTVKHDEVIRFLANGREFAWAFKGMAGTIDMAKIAPAGAVDRPLTVYVWPSARDIADNG
jgi:hypothetical protein